ncbi:MAG TPA: hypothetical protein VHZ32_01275 [Rhizomicrobium sp.]|nr:hypothetical protein [Rhizomicrobium sp.]
MKHGIAGAAFAFLSAVMMIATEARADDVKEFHCGRTLEAPGGLPQLVVDPSLHVLDQTRGGGKFDPGPAPAGVTIKSIFCARSDIVPAQYDYRVVEAGYPLTIFARDTSGKTRIAVLELDGGQLRLRSAGEVGFTPDMVSRIQTFLDASIPLFGKAAPAR